MPKKMEFARGVDDSTGVDKKKPQIVYPIEIQQKLDDVLAIAKTAKTDDERITALGEYKKEIESAAEEFKLVDFRGEKIQNFELQALKKIVQQINEDYARQRGKDKDFEVKDIDIDQIKVKIEDEQIIQVSLINKKLTRIPEAVGVLTNLRNLWITDNQITEISGLDNLTNLQLLLISENQITEISGLDNLTNLQALWIEGNQISTTDEKIKEQIKALKAKKVFVNI